MLLLSEQYAFFSAVSVAVGLLWSAFWFDIVVFFLEALYILAVGTVCFCTCAARLGGE